MAKAFADITGADQARDLPHADWLALLLDRETSWRRDKRLTARLRAARLRQQASVEDVDYRAARGLDRAQERYGRRSTIVTSQLPLSAWHDVIGDPTYADAILDRLVHNAHRIELTGESLRRARSKQAKTA